MLDDPAILDAEQVVVRRGATFRVRLDQGKDEISVSDITPRIEDRDARRLRDVGDARLHAPDSVAHFGRVLGVVSVLDKALYLIELQPDGNRLLECPHQFSVRFGLVAIDDFGRPIDLSMSRGIGRRFRLLPAPMFNDFAILEANRSKATSDETGPLKPSYFECNRTRSPSFSVR
jgi:hypothetical protein